ncbi:hypothetical protein AMS68_007627 [Peltaster fructicola]|uniref:Ribokinase n=1 Tax=Peltaster fructicola TaxID=286661 RepID=A0A6H0Y684_9PEZI|nr:hypothetical protein AMS68_007627 [Peltaster fructicola]
MAAANAVAVIGSLNVDFITRTPRLAAAGETLTATSFDIGFGGKGANQAVACARLCQPNTRVRMVGNLGDDHFGVYYLALLEKEGIETTSISIVESQKTGIANIIVEEDTGENRIMLATNANHAFSATKDAGWDLVPEATDILVFQLEIPIPVVLHNINKGRKMGKHVVLNPAPAVLLPEKAYKDIDTLIMNETEAQILSNDASADIGTSSLGKLARHFLELGVRTAVIITLGAKGVYYATRGDSGTIPAEKVTVVDTTAAGDTFLGAYVAKLADAREKEFGIQAALRYASLAAARTVQRPGAMAAIPHRRELE